MGPAEEILRRESLSLEEFNGETDPRTRKSGLAEQPSNRVCTCWSEFVEVSERRHQRVVARRWIAKERGIVRRRRRARQGETCDRARKSSGIGIRGLRERRRNQGRRGLVLADPKAHQAVKAAIEGIVRRGERGARATATHQVPQHKVEPILADIEPGQVVQFERLGYFAADADQPLLFHRTVGLRDEWANIQKRG